MIKILGTEHQGIFDIQKLEEECSSDKYETIFIEYHTANYWDNIKENPSNYVQNYNYSDSDEENMPWWYELENKYIKLFSSIVFDKEEIKKLTDLSNDTRGIDFEKAIEISTKNNKRIVAIDEDLPNLYKQMSLEDNKEFTQNILQNIGFIFILSNYLSNIDKDYSFKKDLTNIISRSCTNKGSTFKIREIRMCQNIIEHKKEEENSLVITGETHLDNIEKYLRQNTDEKIEAKSLVCNI
jgi:pheromone shutdown protein TraB